MERNQRRKEMFPVKVSGASDRRNVVHQWRGCLFSRHTKLGRIVQLVISHISFSRKPCGCSRMWGRRNRKSWRSTLRHRRWGPLERVCPSNQLFHHSIQNFIFNFKIRTADVLLSDLILLAGLWKYMFCCKDRKANPMFLNHKCTLISLQTQLSASVFSRIINYTLICIQQCK